MRNYCLLPLVGWLSFCAACLSPSSQATSPVSVQAGVHRTLTGQLLGRALFNPAGNSLLFRVADSSGNTTVCVLRIESGKIEVLAKSDVAHISFPTWSPDGKQVAYTSSLWPSENPCALQHVKWTVNVVDIGAPNSRRFIQNARWASYAADGKTISFVRARDKNAYKNDVWLLSRSTGRYMRIDGGAVYVPPPWYVSWAPQSKCLAFCGESDNGHPRLCAWLRTSGGWLLRRSPLPGLLAFSDPQWQAGSSTVLDYVRHAPSGTLQAVRWNVELGRAQILWTTSRKVKWRWVSLVPSSPRVWGLRFVDKQMVLEEYDPVSGRTHALRRFDAVQNENVSISWSSDGRCASLTTERWICVLDKAGVSKVKFTVEKMISLGAKG